MPKCFQPSTLICAQSRSEEGSCYGDSGGPLIADKVVNYETLEAKYQLIAVLHGSPTPCDNAEYGAMYNRVADPDNYQWILDTISGNDNFIAIMF